jgi:general secretion pathway protein M
MAEGNSGKRLRWGSLALFVGAPLLALSLTVLNLVEAAESEAHAAQQEALFAQLQRRVAAGPANALPEDTSALYLKAASDGLAKAELQQHLVRLIAEKAGRLIETQGGDEPTEEESRRVMVRVTLDVTNDGLFAILHGIETGLPLLTVEQMALRKLPGQGGGEDPDPVLRVSLAVVGHWRAKG